MDEKKIDAICAIQRSLGLIEGVSSGIEPGFASALIDAVQIIDESLKELI